MRWVRIFALLLATFPVSGCVAAGAAAMLGTTTLVKAGLDQAAEKEKQKNPNLKEGEVSLGGIGDYLSGLFGE